MVKKKLGFGLMRLPKLDESKEDSIDVEQVKQMVDYFMDHGFTYFDTAWMYMGFASENATREALVDRHPRDSYTLATKLHASFIETKEDRDRVFNEQLKKTGATYFDYYLIHDIESGNYQKYNDLDVFNWIVDKKNQGLVKNIGFSFHDKAELLERILTEHPEMEFVQLQINYLDWNSENVQSRRCYEVATKFGKPVVVMEPVKGGTLANVPEEAAALLKEREPELSVPSWAIRYVASLDNVMMVLSGMSNMEQMKDNVSYMEDFKPLSEGDLGAIEKVVSILNGNIAIPCTGCSYCTDGCPMNIPIPRYFSLYNLFKQGNKPEIRREEYKALAIEAGAASACIECGQCEGICPQHLNVTGYLKDVAAEFE